MVHTVGPVWHGGTHGEARRVAGLAWRDILGEMGMVVVSSTLAAGPMKDTLDEDGQPVGEGGKALERQFPRFADDLAWWTAAAKGQRARAEPPY